MLLENAKGNLSMVVLAQMRQLQQATHAETTRQVSVDANVQPGQCCCSARIKGTLSEE